MSKGVLTIDGVDITHEMLTQAQDKKIYQNLSMGSVEKTGIKDKRYDLISMSLADEHLAS